MLNGGYNNTVGADYGGQTGINHTIETGLNAGVVRQIFSDKFDTVIDDSRFEGQMNSFAGMQSNAGTADSSGESPLIFRCGHISRYIQRQFLIEIDANAGRCHRFQSDKTAVKIKFALLVGIITSLAEKSMINGRQSRAASPFNGSSRKDFI
jgi:hypothetical protein